MEILPESTSNSSAIRRLRYNLTPAESKFKTPMLDHQDKYMMKAQVHVSKSSAISDEQPLPRRKHYCQIYQVVKHMLRGRLLESFQDNEHEVMEMIRLSEFVVRLNLLIPGCLVLTFLCGIHSRSALGITSSSGGNSSQNPTTSPTSLPLKLKQPDEEHAHVENPLSSTRTLSSMKNLDA
nr:cytochrome c maturase subunit B, mitochondrial [Tanacetum cinerariifolium]